MVESDDVSNDVTEPSEASRARARIVASLCDHLADGKHADQWYGVNGNPSHQTIWRWGREEKDLHDAIEEARKAGSHVIVGEAVSIADGTHPLAKGPEDYPGQRKTQCWARFEQAKRIHPQRYGDKVQVGGDPTGVPLEIKSTGPTIPATADLCAGIRKLHELAQEHLGAPAADRNGHVNGEAKTR